LKRKKYKNERLDDAKCGLILFIAARACHLHNTLDALFHAGLTKSMAAIWQVLDFVSGLKLDIANAAILNVRISRVAS